jgi:DNA-binding CsgD family transcriptional regulator
MVHIYRKNTAKNLSDSPISFLSSTAVFDDGKCHIFSKVAGWKDYILPQYEKNSGLLTCRLHSGIHLWKKIPDILFATHEAKGHNKELDIHSVIEFVRRDEATGCFYLYAFYATSENAEKAELFYAKHLDVLLKEVSHFNNDKPTESEYREFFHLSDYMGQKTPTNEPVVSRIEKLELKNREFTTLLLAASGCTVLEIAKKVSRNYKTVESYMAEIRYKTGCKNKKDMNAYVRSKGWQDLIGFWG